MSIENLLVATTCTIANQYVRISPEAGLPINIPFSVSVNNTSNIKGNFTVAIGNSAILANTSILINNLALPANTIITTKPFTLPVNNSLYVTCSIDYLTINLYVSYETNVLPVREIVANFSSGIN